ncbi:MAG: hypothetical protein K0Q79_3724 [Flavipsychrobacter sp.]|nr:hypothetical protein [Flavipsychrobacter sp.]
MEASYEPARGKIFMALNDFEKELGFQDLNLSNLWVRADKQKLLTLINTLRKANPKTRKDILERGMK